MKENPSILRHLLLSSDLPQLMLFHEGQYMHVYTMHTVCRNAVPYTHVTCWSRESSLQVVTPRFHLSVPLFMALVWDELSPPLGSPTPKSNPPPLSPSPCLLLTRRHSHSFPFPSGTAPSAPSKGSLPWPLRIAVLRRRRRSLDILMVTSLLPRRLLMRSKKRVRKGCQARTGV